MHTFRTFLIPGIILVMLLVVSCKKKEDSAPIGQISQVESDKQVVATTVNSAATGFAAVFKNLITDSLSRVAFCRLFTDSSWYFSDQSGYFFIQDFTGWNIAYPTNKNLQGTYLWDLTDPYGNFFIRTMTDSAVNQGHGFIEYYWNNPSSGSTELKLSYVSAIPGIDYFIGSGFYIRSTAPSISLLESNKDISKNATISTAEGFKSIFTLLFTDSLSQVQFIRTYIDSIRFFQNRTGYYFVVDLQGNVLANAANKPLEGTNVYNLQDSRGFYFIRQMITLAENPGSGFVEYYWNNPISGLDEKKLSFIDRIQGTNYFIGSGVYIE